MSMKVSELTAAGAIDDNDEFYAVKVDGSNVDSHKVTAAVLKQYIGAETKVFYSHNDPWLETLFRSQAVTGDIAIQSNSKIIYYRRGNGGNGASANHWRELVIMGGTPHSSTTSGVAPHQHSFPNVHDGTPVVVSAGDLFFNIPDRKIWVNESGGIRNIQGSWALISDAEVPAGGTTGQVLAKTSNVDRAVGWINQVSGSGSGTKVFTSAATTVSPVTNITTSEVSPQDLIIYYNLKQIWIAQGPVGTDYEDINNWAELTRFHPQIFDTAFPGRTPAESLTFGGESSERGDIVINTNDANVWIKTGTGNLLADWIQLPTLPIGGATGQVLAKRSDAHGDATWQNSPVVAPTFRVITTEAPGGAVTFPADGEYVLQIDTDDVFNLGSITTNGGVFTLPKGKVYRITSEPFTTGNTNINHILKSKPVGGVDRTVNSWEVASSARPQWIREFKMVKYLDLRTATVDEEVRYAVANTTSADITTNASGDFIVPARTIHIEEW